MPPASSSTVWLWAAANLGFDRALEKFLDDRGADFHDFEAHGGLRAFTARQFLLTADDAVETTELLRGSPPVVPDAARQENRAADVADGVTRWMLRNLSPNGALPYKYLSLIHI